MRKVTGIIASLLTISFLSLFFFFFAKPKVQFPLYDYVLLIAIVQGTGFLVVRLLGGSGIKGAILMGLISAFATAILLVYFLEPAMILGFDFTFIIILTIEMVGLVLGFVFSPSSTAAQRG